MNRTSHRLLLALLALPAFLGLSACQGTPRRPVFTGPRPLSILVLPPLDETLEEGASALTLATVTAPLAERGYYVFPVAVVDLMMRENGLPTPFEMHQVPLEKLVEVFDPDAVLYLKVTEWGSSYQILASVTRVRMEARLVDARTGQKLWSGVRVTSSSSGSGGGGIGGLLIGAIVGQVANSLSDPSYDLARQNSWNLFTNPRRGLPLGLYHSDFASGEVP